MVSVGENSSDYAVPNTNSSFSLMEIFSLKLMGRSDKESEKDSSCSLFKSIISNRN